MSLYQKYNAKKREKKNIFLYGNLLWEFALGICSGEFALGNLLWGICSGEFAWGICSGEFALGNLPGEFALGNLLWGICSGEVLGGWQCCFARGMAMLLWGSVRCSGEVICSGEFARGR